MFKHCLSKFSCALVMMCALVTGGLLQSCEDVFDLDEYKYDDSEPDWLGPSIYKFLETGNAGHTYTNYVRLIEDLDQKEVLSRTGSRTMFVADDAAFDRFFNSDNAWGVKSYDELSRRQKKILLYNVTLKNAYLLDMLATIKSSATTEQTGGDCLRRETMATLYDSVPFFTNEELTVDGKRNTLRLPQNNKPFKYYKEYLEKSGKDGLRIAFGKSNPMIVHFLYEYARTQNIQDKDFEYFFNYEKTKKRRTGTEGTIFANKILKSDVSYGDLSDDTMTITCKNGYLYRMDDVLVPPSNMAQVLREQENTKLFSRMLDYFAYLEYDEDVTEDYNAFEHEGKPEENENVYLLKYALSSGKTDEGQAYYTPNESGLAGKDATLSTLEHFGPNDYLIFDPGEAQYNSGNGVQSDMAALLVPTDEMIYRFFTPERYQLADKFSTPGRSYGVGASILEEYCSKDDLDNLQEVEGEDMDFAAVMQPCLDSIPLNIIAAFVNNLMKKSFLTTMPSNFPRVRNDANDEMGLTPEDIDECVLANNGVIYILNNVFGPAKYQAVMTPPTIMQNMMIMRTAIKELRYESYLLAMKSKYSFIIPDDSNIMYYDVSTFKSKAPKAYKLTWGKVFQSETSEDVIYTECIVDTLTYEIKEEKAPQKSVFSKYKSLFEDLMEYFVITDTVETFYATGEDAKEIKMNQYYLTKGYGTVKVTKDENGNVRFQGGEQLELSRRLGRDVYVTVKENGRYKMTNGIAYSTEGKDANYTSGVVSPPTKSVYSYLEPEENNPLNEFGKLCMALSDVSLYVDAYGYKTTQLAKDTISRYRIFSNEHDYNKKVYDQVVPFFSKYHYTVYVPQPSALQEAFENGLPTKEDIRAEIDAGNKERAKSMIRLLNKFLRYHFQDNSVVVDVNPFEVKLANGGSVDTARYETSVIDDKTGRFFDLLVKTADDKSTLTVTDDMDRVAKVMNKEGEEGITWNILTRDIFYKGNITSSTTNSVAIESSSYAVVHQIDKALYNSNIIGYDGRFIRFAKEGEPIVKMNIPVPVPNNVASDIVTYENKEYLVGKAKTFQKVTDKGRVDINTAYLMQPTGNSDSKFDKEDYFKVDGNKVLITDAGHLVSIDNSKKLRYLWADMTPLSENAQGVACPDSIVTVLPDGTFVDVKGKVIKK